MDREGKQSEGGLAANGFVWLAIVAAGVFLVRELPWEGSRPPGAEPMPYTYVAEQDIDARLWQDPIGAITRALDEAKRRNERIWLRGVDGPEQSTEDHPAKALVKTISQRCEDGNDALVMGVMVPGGSYQEMAEVRRRYRYAVLAGLNEKGYAPEDPEHIGYFKVEAKQSSLPEFIPYEWLRLKENNEKIPVPAKSSIANASDPYPPPTATTI